MKLLAITLSALVLVALGGVASYELHRPATHVVTKTVKVESSSHMAAVRITLAATSALAGFPYRLTFVDTSGFGGRALVGWRYIRDNAGLRDGSTLCVLLPASFPSWASSRRLDYLVGPHSQLVPCSIK